MTQTVEIPEAFDLTAQELRALVCYDPLTGIFVWRRSFGNLRAGARCGRLHVSGYRQIGIRGKRHKAGRLAYLYMTGAWPADEIDHINLTRDDDRWVNLRIASRKQNAGNKRKRPDNSSGVPGVAWDRARGKWRAQIRRAGKQVGLGRFDHKRDAMVAYRLAALKEWGEYAPYAVCQ